ncbi:MAG TPA: replicative DNA helicase [Gemmatimonadaceae bacterium]|nr:replicative DNA helicase [Gemmatimonadaceae bacterium]
MSDPTTGRDPFRDRRPPYSEEAEAAVLGAVLLDRDALAKAFEFVDETMFYREGHRLLFRAMRLLESQGNVIDPLTLSDELGRQGDLARAGGKEYIAVLIDAVPTAANIEYHAKIVREKALLRRLIEVSTSIVQEAFDGQQTAAELLDAAEHKILQVSNQRGTEGFIRIKNLLWPAMEKIDSLMQSGGDVTGVASGFSDLDKLTLGFQPSDLVIVAARPSMGKTALVLNIAQYVALEREVPVAIFSLEMSKESLATRMLASEGLIDAQKLRSGRLSTDEYKRLSRAAGLLINAPIYIDDSAGLNLLELRSRARRVKVEHDVKLVIVDYLQLVQGPSDSESRQQEISAISRSLKILAKELGVPVLALSQLSRAPEQRAGEHRRPQLSDLRDSGAIEQDADLVMFIYRQEMYEPAFDEQGNPRSLPDGTPLEGLAELIVAKQRNGPTGTVKLFFHKQYTRFDNFARRQHSGPAVA